MQQVLQLPYHPWYNSGWKIITPHFCGVIIQIYKYEMIDYMFLLDLKSSESSSKSISERLVVSVLSVPILSTSTSV